MTDTVFDPAEWYTLPDGSGIPRDRMAPCPCGQTVFEIRVTTYRHKETGQVQRACIAVCAGCVPIKPHSDDKVLGRLDVARESRKPVAATKPKTDPIALMTNDPLFNNMPAHLKRAEINRGFANDETRRTTAESVRSAEAGAAYAPQRPAAVRPQDRRPQAPQGHVGPHAADHRASA